MIDQDDDSAQRHSFNGSVKRSNSDERLSAMEIEDEEDAARMKLNQTSQIPKLRQSKQFSHSSPTVNKPETSSNLKWTSSIHTRKSIERVTRTNVSSRGVVWVARAVVQMPSISRRAVQGVRVRFFRNGDAHHAGVSVAINELELKSWEAFLNYLNRQQKKLTLSNGGIKHVYSLTGREIRSISKFQSRQSYVVASGPFIKTNYVHINDALPEEPESLTRWRSPPSNAEQLFLLPYSRMNIYESMLFNRNLPSTFDQWLNGQVTELLARFIGQQTITHLYAITKFAFTEVRNNERGRRKERSSRSRWRVSLSYSTCSRSRTRSSGVPKRNTNIRNIISPRLDRVISSSIAFGHGNLWTLSNVMFLNKVMFFLSLSLCHHQQHCRGSTIILDLDVSTRSLRWSIDLDVVVVSYGYDGMTDQTKTLHSLVGESEILYVIGSVCVLYEPLLKQQRFYTKHTSAITWWVDFISSIIDVRRLVFSLNTHRYHPLVASSEITSLKDRSRVLIYVWNPSKLETLAELRREQFGSDISLLNFGPKSDDNLLLVVSREKPKVLLIVDWKRNELISSLTVSVTLERDSSDKKML